MSHPLLHDTGLHDLPCFQMYLGWRRAQALYKPVLEPLLNPQRLYVLSLLSHAGPLPMGELARALDVDPGSASGLVSRMERDDLVERRRGKDDRLTVLARATRKGRAVCKRASEELEELDQRLLAEFEDRDLVGLQRIVEAFERLASARAPGEREEVVR